MKTLGKMIVGVFLLAASYGGTYLALVTRDANGLDTQITFRFTYEVEDGWFNDDDDGRYHRRRIEKLGQVVKFYCEAPESARLEVIGDKVIATVVARDASDRAKIADLVTGVVTSVGRTQLRGPPTQMLPAYRFGGELSRSLFSLAHAIDRRLRSQFWSYSSYRQSVGPVEPAEDHS